MHYLVALPKVLSHDSISMSVYCVIRMIYHKNLIDGNFFIALQRKIIASIRFSMFGHTNAACYQVVSPYSLHVTLVNHLLKVWGLLTSNVDSLPHLPSWSSSLVFPFNQLR